jgi:hypothetical protein
MGTRADFYIGRGEKAEWLGSIAWDGYPGDKTHAVLNAANKRQFVDAVTDIASNSRDFTPASEGWPWPWEDSSTTDYAYAYDGEKVWVSCFGSAWMTPAEARNPDFEPASDKAVFPKMSRDKAAPLGSHRSGVMVVGIARKP